MLITVFVFSLFSAPWELIQAVKDPIAAAGVFKYGEGTIAPRFIIEDLEGNRVRLKDFRGTGQAERFSRQGGFDHLLDYLVNVVSEGDAFPGKALP
jgi:hypothetical protein